MKSNEVGGEEKEFQPIATGNSPFFFHAPPPKKGQEEAKMGGKK